MSTITPIIKTGIQAKKENIPANEMMWLTEGPRNVNRLTPKKNIKALKVMITTPIFVFDFIGLF